MKFSEDNKYWMLFYLLKLVFLANWLIALYGLVWQNNPYCNFQNVRFSAHLIG